ncbi:MULTISPECIES: ornithine cyclodeaminase family protein [unclassified Pseudomonas]|uniref:ornithine cyclodeaminase family protein n=1 Tax=unclassified Pseudomonas TaxID=196821 RepID=UPI000BCC84EC|nr:MULTISPECIES: ornithine cyclodeaminase family protein [unclassified Pseudomonas]PVZ19719.1 ornithine cyclodeaminase [Pseudomonas sp. URIL14HWK12:I12]PVZ22696.1 ornithine cyclodeaminase [Pseudomonas sp. URIL14HWK12:I10]PVZ37674.1 ornithine cyclodeaminase [Pseudomonas sp. URIL14HWK12:I11]SNZ15478.1 ornithine cyclodeaminase [Pseudomonas sp. URIL14HWK12:I9]
MQIFDAQHTRSALAFGPLIEALHEAFVRPAQVPFRHIHDLSSAVGESANLLLMPAWNAEFFGIKTVSVYPGNAQRQQPGLHSTYMLYDATNGAPLALIDGNEITSRRTAAASALAGAMLARPDARNLLVVGAGRVGSLLAEAYATVRSLGRVMVWDINLQSAHALSARLAREGFDAHVVDSLEAACGQADIVSCATLSTAPLIKRAWLREGTHLDLIGGFTPQMREADDDCFKGTQVFVDTPEALMKAGDLLDPIAAGVFGQDQVRADLAALCQGKHPGRTDAQGITVFKAVGTALEDLAAAQLVYSKHP